MRPMLSCILLLALAAAAAAEVPAITAGYADHASLTTELKALATRHPEVCRVRSIGESRGNKALWVVELARGQAVDQRSAIAIVAGIDGDQPATTAVATHLIRALLAAEAETPARRLLEEHVVYVLPSVNPDALASFFDSPHHAQREALRPVDDDRDGRPDEDGPEDLNGDGLITQMRVRLDQRHHPDLQPTHIVDPQEPRLMKAANRDKGERPVYAILVEGLDNDGDGAFNEDGQGGVDLNRNFAHRHEEHASGAGPHPISEPESRALIEFFLENTHIAAAFFYGRHDNIAKIAGSGGGPGGAGRAAARGSRGGRSGRGGGGGGPPGGGRRRRPEPPTGLHADDTALYSHLSKRYAELTGVKEAASEASGGSAFAWCYAEYGIPTFACQVWGTAPKPEPEPQPETESPEDNAEGDKLPGWLRKAYESAVDTEDEVQPSERPRRDREGRRGRRGRGRGGRRRGGGPGPGGPGPDGMPGAEAKKEGPTDKAAAAWLKYSDEQRAGSGFVAWTAFDHPQLGSVEIGGFAPYFRTTPPGDATQDIARKQLAFVAEVGSSMPRPVLQPPVVRRAAEGVYDISVILRNDGQLPTALHMGVANRKVHPIVLNLDIAAERLLGGQKQHKVWRLAGHGESRTFRWLVRGTAGSTVDLKMTSQKFGDRKMAILLEENAGRASDD